MCVDDETHTDLGHMLWLSIFDVVKSNRDLAGKVWDQADQFKIDQNLCFLLVNDVVHPNESIRVAAAEALADAVKHNNKTCIPHILNTFYKKYAELALVRGIVNVKNYENNHFFE